VRLIEIVRAKKQGVSLSSWHVGKIPHANFPLGKKRALPAGDDWSWKLIEFDALNRHFRVLLRLNEDKEYYSAILGMDDPRGLVIICHHELHTSHRDWHCHLVRGSVLSIYPGVLRDMDMMRVWPSNSGPSLVEFNVDRKSAVGLAVTRFNLEVRDRAQWTLL